MVRSGGYCTYFGIRFVPLLLGLRTCEPVACGISFAISWIGFLRGSIVVQIESLPF